MDQINDCQRDATKADLNEYNLINQIRSRKGWICYFKEVKSMELLGLDIFKFNEGRLELTVKLLKGLEDFH